MTTQPDPAAVVGYCTDPLPSPLSALVLLAVDTLQMCIEDPDITIDMKHYHQPAQLNADGKLHVCFAGSLIAVHIYPGHPDELCTPADFPEHAPHLEALEHVRTGDLCEAIARIAGGDPFPPPFASGVAVNKFHTSNPRHFLSSMRNNAEKLRTAGY